MMLSDNYYGHRRHFTTHKYSFLFSCCTYIAVFIFMMLSDYNYVHSENEGRHLSFHMCPNNDALGQQLSAMNVGMCNKSFNHKRRIGLSPSQHLAIRQQDEYMDYFSSRNINFILCPKSLFWQPYNAC